jgi:hypothetical protein
MGQMGEREAEAEAPEAYEDEHGQCQVHARILRRVSEIKKKKKKFVQLHAHTPTNTQAVYQKNKNKPLRLAWPSPRQTARQIPSQGEGHRQRKGQTQERLREQHRA